MKQSTVDHLSRFEITIDGESFKALFIQYGGTVSMADHMWSKFRGYDHSILRLWQNADGGNRKIILSIINKWVEAKGW